MIDFYKFNGLSVLGNKARTETPNGYVKMTLYIYSKIKEALKCKER